MQEQWTECKGLYPPYELQFTCPWYWGPCGAGEIYFIDLTGITQALAEIERV